MVNRRVKSAANKSLRDNMNDETKREFELLIRKEAATLKKSLLEIFENKQNSYKRKLILSRKKMLDYIIKCNVHEATNFSRSMAKAKNIYRQVERFKNNHKGSKVENIVIHVETNHIQKESPKYSSRKMCKLLQKAKSDSRDSAVCFSGILPKSVFESINYIDETVFNLCAATNDTFVFHQS